MSAFSDLAENRLIDWFFRGQAIGITGASAAAGTGPTSLFMGLLTAAPSDSGGGTEVTGGAYARVTVASNMTNWDATQGGNVVVASTGTGGQTKNNIPINFPTPSANWGSVTHVGVYDATSAGNLVAWAVLTLPKTVNNGDIAPSFAINALTFTLA